MSLANHQLQNQLQNHVSNRPIDIIFEIANNHQGSVEHFEKILSCLTGAVQDFKPFFNFFIKFQFRNLETFINPNLSPSENKHIPRFLSTQLTDTQWNQVVTRTKESGFGVITTPFDEDSVLLAKSFEITTLKIASCSSREWSLLELASKNTENLIVSTGGCSLADIDDIYSFLYHRIPGKFTLMHCCGIYPAPVSELRLSTISNFKQRYPSAKIGYSGHEDPNKHWVSCTALTLGATTLERHVGLVDQSRNININSYSLSANSVIEWLTAMRDTITAISTPKTINYSNVLEQQSLRNLQRGLLSNRFIAAGENLELSDVSFRFPLLTNQISVSDFTSIYTSFQATTDIYPGSLLTSGNTKKTIDQSKRILHTYIHSVRGVLATANVKVEPKTPLEISHHYGINQLFTFGCALVNIINRNYCKKLIIILEGQTHPEQYHDIKEETFSILYGSLLLYANGTPYELNIGDSFLVRPGVRHSFKGLTDCLIEELSTTSIPSDSIYTDAFINSLGSEHRKTVIPLHFPT